jgi:predicted nuclease with TOPRIM domain
MSKKSDERKNDVQQEESQPNEEQEELQQLIEQVDQRAEELEKEKEKNNPEGRLSWNQLYNMFTLIEGYDPRGRPNPKSNNGIINRPYRNSELFASKLKTNSTEVRNKFVVVNGVMPQFEDSDKAQEFFDKREELVKEYTGISDTSNFTDQELEQILRNKNKLEQFEGEYEHLESEYPDVVETLEKQNEFKRKPLVKCKFDIIKRKDIKGTGLGAKEQRILDPMLDF